MPGTGILRGAHFSSLLWFKEGAKHEGSSKGRGNKNQPTHVGLSFHIWG